MAGMSLTATDITTLVDKASVAAKAAGEAVMKIYRGDFDVEHKNDGSPVTEADLAADAIIEKELATTGIPILSEETIDDISRMESDALWIVDPLDGTSGFVDGHGDFVVMIGLVENGFPIAGVVYRPVTGELITGVKGQGASLTTPEGEVIPLSVSAVNQMSQTRIVTSRHHISARAKAFVESAQISEIIQVGSVGIKVGYIAQATADVYFTTTDQMGEWDLCAPHAILEAAGGRMTGFAGEEIRYNKHIPKNPHGVLATNGELHDAMLAFFSKFDEAKS